MRHSLASPSSVAHVMYQKYVNAMPLYRQEKEWEQYGIKLSRATLANWVIRCAQDWLVPITKALHKELLKREVLHADETTLQVLNEPGKKATTDSYMWLYRTGNDGKAPIILYDYQSSRSGKILKTTWWALKGTYIPMVIMGMKKYKLLSDVAVGLT